MSDVDTEHISVETWNGLSPEDQLQYVRLLEKSDHEFRQMLKLIPECPDHGDQCIPHAREWIASVKQRLLSARYGEGDGRVMPPPPPAPPWRPSFDTFGGKKTNG